MYDNFPYFFQKESLCIKGFSTLSILFANSLKIEKVKVVSNFYYLKKWRKKVESMENR